jgi:RNA polymerase sigma-70 factor, ECF subfamily
MPLCRFIGQVPIWDVQCFAASSDYGVWTVGLRGRNERRAGRVLAGLYEEHGRAVFAFALHLSGTREDAEDVVQSAFLQAFRALEAGERLVNPRAWLMVVARRQVYNLWRSRRESARGDLAEAIIETSDGEALSELRRVRMVLFSLPESQHQAFVLRHWSGLSNREIADVLETSESAVETLLVRARSAILAEGHGANDACAAVRERLAAARATSRLDAEHIGRCKRCSRAKERLVRITAAAAVAALVPRAHVAQALAAAIHGFKTRTGVAAGLAAGKASVAKVVVAGVLSVGTIAVTAPIAAHAIHHHFHHPTPIEAQHQAAEGVGRQDTLEVQSTRWPALATHSLTARSPRRSDHAQTGDDGEGRGSRRATSAGSQGGGTQDGNSGSGSQQGSSGDGSQDGNSGNRSTSSDSKSADTQGAGSQDGGGQDGDQTPSPNASRAGGNDQ